MKQINKLTTAIALALGLGFASHANATITLESGGKGDTLLFPFFAGAAENYFAIMNDHLFYGDRQTDENTAEQWVQVHIRFLGAGWSGELLDFDVILSPHDVMVFRVADVDGDGYWEIDQTLDPKNFEYTGMLGNCKNEQTGVVLANYNCMDQSNWLIPPVGGNVDQPLINYHRQWGHIEVIGEGILNGMTHPIMNNLIAPTNAGKLANQGQRRVDKQLGTHLWSWTNAGNVPGNADKGATDVPNVLSGTAFVTLPGASHGLSYNAEAFMDFRTAANLHRIDNYPPAPAVIIHDEDASPNRAAGASPAGDYVYGFPFDVNAVAGPNNLRDDRQDEARLSFSVTWGPSLADGDDYNPIPTMTGITRPVNGAGQDNWDQVLTPANLAKLNDHINSIAEVEEAIRLSGQRYTGFWLNGQPVGFNSDNTPVATTLFSYYYALFPTKYFYGENAAFVNPPTSFSTYLNSTVSTLVGPTMSKVMEANLWDIYETPICPTTSTTTCVISPCKLKETEDCKPIVFPYEGQLKTIQGIEGEILNGLQRRSDFVPGKGKFSTWPLDNANNPGLLPAGAHPSTLKTWPLLMYTFELEAANPSPDGAVVHHWKSMHR